MTQFFNKDASKTYDEKNRRLAAISDNMHFLIRLILQDLPARAQILCVGVGTGAEILSLSKVFPEWSFVGVDPSASMLEVCRERLTNEDVIDSCQLITGYVQDIPSTEKFDAVLSVLVGHFVKRDERLAFYQNISKRTRAGGYAINTEISFDLNSPEFPSMLENWKKIQALMGGTPESLASLPTQLRDMLTVLPPMEIEALLKQSGFAKPVRFYQAFMISGWYSKKE
jgi:tRNA (cmo5U34)-methyltransferase